MERKILHYLKVWWILSRNSFAMVLSQKIAVWFFLTGKIIRFIFFAGFLYFLMKGTGSLAGFTQFQVIFFFLTFNLVDVISQFFFREAYRFRPKVVSGDFDLTLTKPISPLFSVLFGGADIMDLITIPPLLLALFWVGSMLNPTFTDVIIYLVLIVNSLVIATAFHIFVMAMGIITMEIDHTLMIYRDLTSLGRFPVDIYREPLKSVLTFMLPVGIMMSVPAKALMGVAGYRIIFFSFFAGAVLLIASLKFWKYALKRYSSASS